MQPVRLDDDDAASLQCFCGYLHTSVSAEDASGSAVSVEDASGTNAISSSEIYRSQFRLANRSQFRLHSLRLKSLRLQSLRRGSPLFRLQSQSFRLANRYKYQHSDCQSNGLIITNGLQVAYSLGFDNTPLIMVSDLAGLSQVTSQVRTLLNQNMRKIRVKDVVALGRYNLYDRNLHYLRCTGTL